MTTYVTLCNWTEDGLQNYKESVHRSEEFTKLVENGGGQVREILWTIGEYDSLAITDFPDDETAVATLLQVGAKGQIRTRTLRAFDSEAMSAILRKAG
ncbi:MAG TPA: GYD domain-containing protein [Streptosporangiaceae bacterium]|nr:GYD domain-containing protein [Streptosporangiaceae bacterium]